MQELPFLHSARRLMLIDICMKFREDSFRGFQVTERTRFVTDRGQTDIRTSGRPGKNNMSPNSSGGDIKSGDTVFPIITLSVTMETSGWIWSKVSFMLSLPANMKSIRSRTAEKKWRHHFSHYKPMGIFSDVQGQLTPQPVVCASRNSNSSELSCVSSLPASMKRIER